MGEVRVGDASAARTSASGQSCAPSASRCRSVTRRNRLKNVSAGGRRRMPRKSMSWAKTRVSPRLASFTRCTSVSRPGTNRAWPIRSSGPDGTSRIPVASRTIAPGRPCAKRTYQSMLSCVTKPSPVARHGTIAGIHVRVRRSSAPCRSGENRRDDFASPAVGQVPGRVSCRIFSGGFHMVSMPGLSTAALWLFRTMSSRLSQKPWSRHAQDRRSTFEPERPSCQPEMPAPEQYGLTWPAMLAPSRVRTPGVGPC